MFLNNRFFYELIVCSIVLFLSSDRLWSQQLAFPGAEGYGRFTTGGRGGVIVEVTNLNDTGNGSLRAAIQSSQTRTVVFRVSGTIALNSELRITNDNITIAGQTAPGDGVCIKNYPLIVDADNVIIRYMRFRLGDEKNVEADALGGRFHSDIIIDHCSASWSVDECVSFYQNENLTLQWCLISESLYESVHDKGTHGYGGIWGGYNCSFHHNLLAHHTSRNPRFASDDASNPEGNVDSRNNVIYNWGYNSCYGGENSSINLFANYYKYGPATGPKDRIAEPSAKSNTVPVGEWYIEDNHVWGYPEITSDNWAGGVQGAHVDNARIYEPRPFAPVVTHEAETAYQLILADAGAVRPKRDLVDIRIVSETRNQTATYGGVYGAGSGIIDTPTDVGGWPVLTTYDIPEDNDSDGMADEWELENGLDPENSSDRNGDVNGDGYTNLENYLNSLCFRNDYLPAPGNLEALSASNEEIIIKWQEAALNENGFIIERSEGDTLSFIEVGTAFANETSFIDNGLSSLTTYYYRIRAFHDSAQSLNSNYISVKTVYPDGRPLEPNNPFPLNNAEDVHINSRLSWANAGAANSYNVSLGTTEAPEFMENQISNIFNPEGLQDSTRYYWRIDAVNNFGTTTGNLWTFFTENLKDTIVGHWPLNLRTSRTLDVSGNNNYAYLMNMESSNWIDDGITGRALHFNGIDDHLLVYYDDAIGFNILGFTLSFWIRQSITNKKMPWISKAKFDGETWGTRYELYHSSDGMINFIVDDGVEQSSLETANDEFVTGEWTMVSAVRDKENEKLRLYANDKLIAVENDMTWDLTENAHLYFGTNAQTSKFFEGDIDEIVMFNYALDSIAIKELYLNTISNIESDDKPIIPLTFELSNYPNPFNSTTTFHYSIPKAGQVTLSISDIRGKHITTLIDDFKTARHYKF